MASSSLILGNTASDRAAQINGGRVGVFIQSISINNEAAAIRFAELLTQKSRDATTIMETTISGASDDDLDESGATATATMLAVFGKRQAYFLSLSIAGKVFTRWDNMPESTLAYLPGGEKGISVWFWASLNPDNLFSVGFQKEDGRVGYYSDIGHPRIHKWMESEPADYRNSRVVIGPGYSYVAWHPAKEVLYENIPQRLEDAIDERGVPDQIALGVNGGFVASWDDGTVEWDSLEAYFGLSRWLEDRSDSGIELIALNPGGREFYVQFADGSAYYDAKLGNDFEDATNAHHVRRRFVS